jgi:hypothetical protein
MAFEHVDALVVGEKLRPSLDVSCQLEDEIRWCADFDRD